jgi:hypothetical protein
MANSLIILLSKMAIMLCFKLLFGFTEIWIFGRARDKIVNALLISWFIKITYHNGKQISNIY